MCRRLTRDIWRGSLGADLVRMRVGEDPVLPEILTPGRGSHSHESGRRPGSVAGSCSRYHHASRLTAVYGRGTCACTHPPRSLPPHRALPAVAHAHAMGTPMGLFDHLAQISLACEWEETRFHDWLAITPPPRQKAQGCLLTWRMRPRTHHVRYHHAELCPTWRIRT